MSRTAASLRIAAPPMALSSRGLAVGLAALVVFHFLVTAGLRPLISPDEGRYVSIARDMLLSGDWITPRLNGIPFLDKPILFYWLTAGSMALFGETPFAMRLVPASMGSIASLLLYVVGSRLFDRTAGLVAASALATMPLFYLGAHVANMDLQVAFWITCTLSLALLALESSAGAQRDRLWLAAHACAAGGVLTKGLIGAVLPALVLGAWLLASRRWRTLAQMRPVAGAVLFLAICAPWFVAVQWRNPAFFDYFVLFQHFGRYTGTSFNNPQPAWYFLGVLAVALLPWSSLLPYAVVETVRGIRARDERRDRLLFVAAWAVVVIAFFSVPTSKPVGYVLPAVPPIALLVGIAVSRLIRATPSSAWRDPLVGGAVGSAALTGCLVWAIGRQPRLEAVYPQLRGSLAVLLVAAVLVAALVAWLRRRPGCHRHSGVAAAALFALLGALTCTLLIARVPLETADAQQRLGEALRAALAARPAPVAFFETFPYTTPVYAGLREPVLLIDRWDDPRTTAQDDWRATLWRGARWQPGSEQLFRLPDAALIDAARRPSTYVVAEPGNIAKLEAQAARQPGVAMHTIYRNPRYVLARLDSR